MSKVQHTVLFITRLIWWSLCCRSLRWVVWIWGAQQTESSGTSDPATRKLQVCVTIRKLIKFCWRHHVCAVKPTCGWLFLCWCLSRSMIARNECLLQQLEEALMCWRWRLMCLKNEIFISIIKMSLNRQWTVGHIALKHQPHLYFHVLLELHTNIFIFTIPGTISRFHFMISVDKQIF